MIQRILDTFKMTKLKGKSIQFHVIINQNIVVGSVRKCLEPVYKNTT